MFRRFAPKIGLKFGFGAAVMLAILPTVARAQVNIDKGKSAAEIFQNDCATCHKTTRGLANGKNSLTLSDFLRQHYTASHDQAAALAAYVLGGGGAAPAPAQKPAQEHAKATGEEPKSGEPKTAEPKTAEPKTAEPKTAEPKTPEPKTAEPKTAEPKTALRPKPEAATAPAVNAAPRSVETPRQGGAATNSAAAPAESQPSENAAVPRDNIPD